MGAKVVGGRWEGCVSVRSLVGGMMVVVLRSYEAFRLENADCLKQSSGVEGLSV